MSNLGALGKEVFPARAGMSRSAEAEDLKGPCVPRASGDEPQKAEHPTVMRVCSPRERG